MSTAAPNAGRTIIDQAEDFLSFQIDDYAFDLDLTEAGDKLAEIDRRHKDDLFECLDCGAKFAATPGQQNAACPSPACGSARILVDQSFLDDVAAYIRSKGAKRCGRKAAYAVYDAVCQSLARLKKNTVVTPASPSGSESTQLDGLPVANEHF